MRAGLTLRVALSHLILVLASLTVFLVALTTTTRGTFAATEGRVDRATAVRLAPWLEQYYSRQGSWRGVDQLLEAALPAASHMAPRPDDRMMARRGVQPRELPVAQPLVILDDSGALVAVVGASRSLARDALSELRPVLQDGQPIGPASDPYGWLFVGSMIPGTGNPLQTVISATLARAGFISAAIILVLATIVAAYWSRWLLRPLKALETASRTLAAGDFETRVPVPRGKHELRSLAESFNAMAEEIGAQEATRRRFIADAAHELRTPVTLMSTRIEMLREGIYEPGPEQWQALERSADRLGDLVDDLQVLARLDAGRVVATSRAVDPADVLSQLTHEFGPAARQAGVTLKTQTRTETAPAVLADPGRLHQVLANLLANALRHTPEGGRVLLGARASSAASAASSPPASSHLQVELSVEDTGPGIPEEERERVFERFVRLDQARAREQGGSGLGLAIARHLTELQGGSIRVESASESDHGARFVVTMPPAGDERTATTQDQTRPGS